MLKLIKGKKKINGEGDEKRIKNPREKRTHDGKYLRPEMLSLRYQYRSTLNVVKIYVLPLTNGDDINE
nr:2274_t:CDS:2 [Entrophospora candida]